MKKVICCVSLMLSISAFADNLIEFQTGQTATAAEVNHNFDVIKEQFNENVGVFNELQSRGMETITYETASAGNFSNSYYSDSVVASCPAGEAMTGGGVWCDHPDFNENTTNWGHIDTSFPSGNSYIGGCRSNDNSISLSKSGPPITVYAVCIRYGSDNLNSRASSETVKRLPRSQATTAIDQLEQGAMDEVATAAYDRIQAQLEAKAAALVRGE